MKVNRLPSGSRSAASWTPSLAGSMGPTAACQVQVLLRWLWRPGQRKSGLAPTRETSPLPGRLRTEQVSFQRVADPALELLQGPVGVLDELPVDPGRGQCSVDRLSLGDRHPQVTAE